MKRTRKINIITESIYCGVKAIAKKPQDDTEAMKRFGIGATTVRQIRNTKTYKEYRERYAGNHDKSAAKPSETPHSIPTVVDDVFLEEPVKINILDDDFTEEINDRIEAARQHVIHEIGATRALAVWMTAIICAAILMAVLILR